MRERHHLGPLAVQAIGGTAVLMLGFDPDEGSATELLGFAVRRTDHTYLVRAMGGTPAHTTPRARN